MVMVLTLRRDALSLRVAGIPFRLLISELGLAKCKSSHVRSGRRGRFRTIGLSLQNSAKSQRKCRAFRVENAVPGTTSAIFTVPLREHCRGEHVSPRRSGRPGGSLKSSGPRR